MNSHTWEHAPLATAVVSPKSSGALVLLPGIVWRCWRSMFWSHISGSTRRSGCIKPQAYGLRTPPSIDVWFGSVDNHKGSCSWTGCLWHMVTLKKILWIPYTQHVTNASVKETTSCPAVSSIMKTRLLHFFGHVVRSYSGQDHQAVSASLRPPRDWRRPRGRHRRLHTTWLRGIDAEVQSANISSIHSAWRKAKWPTIVFSGDVSSTRQNSIRGTPLKKKNVLDHNYMWLLSIIVLLFDLIYSNLTMNLL